jgi:F0F1-type ATP synthase alpha subunit
MKLISSSINRVNIQLPVKSLSIASLLLASNLFSAIDPVFAAGETCSKVNVTLQNKSSSRIKILQVQYPGNKKGDKTSDYITKLTQKIVIPGANIAEVIDYNNLRPVKISELVSMLVSYSKDLGNGKFSAPITMKSSSLKCSNGMSQTLVLK